MGTDRSDLAVASDGMTVVAGRTDPGRVRSENEDAFLTDAGLGLWVIADGMGGHRDGARASALAVATICEFVRASRDDGEVTWPYGFESTQAFEANQLRNSIYLAHRNIQADGHQATDDGHQMGSTVVAAILRDRQITFANVGDSRLYRVRAGQLEQLSVDHSWAAAAVRAGANPAAIRQHPMRHMLTHALGHEVADVPVRQEPLEDGDALLLCTDGLYGALSEAAILEVLTDERDVDAQADALITLANAAGGPDNITVVVGRHGEQPRKKRWWS